MTNALGKWFSHLSLVLGLTLAPVVRASVPAVRATITAPGPNLDYAMLVKDIDQATFAVIYYYDGTKTVVSDPEWMGMVKRLIDGADGKPDSTCFCINFPQVVFANKEGKIASLEVPHGNKLRFGGNLYAGDYYVGEKIGALMTELLLSQHDRGSKIEKTGAARGK